MNGDVDNPKEMVITPIQVYLMHIGSATTTEYDFGTAILDIIDKYPHLDMYEDGNENIKYGLIHSHQNFSVFFSGTDTGELQENGPKHNQYFSIITNNAGDFEARLTVKGTIKRSVEFSFATRAGGKIEDNKSNEAEDVLYYYKCDIDKTSSLPNGFEDRFAEIKAIADKPAIPHHSTNFNQFKNNYNKFNKTNNDSKFNFTGSLKGQITRLNLTESDFKGRTKILEEIHVAEAILGLINGVESLGTSTIVTINEYNKLMNNNKYKFKKSDILYNEIAKIITDNRIEIIFKEKFAQDHPKLDVLDMVDEMQLFLELEVIDGYAIAKVISDVLDMYTEAAEENGLGLVLNESGFDKCPVCNDSGWNFNTQENCDNCEVGINSKFNYTY